MNSLSRAEMKRLILAGDEEKINAHLVKYLANSPTIDAEILIDLAFKSSSMYFVSEIIKGLAYRRFDSQCYRDLVWHGLHWPFPDTLDIVLLASLNRLPKYSSSETEMRLMLRSLLEHPRPVVRDALAEIAQRALGVPDRDIYYTSGSGTLLQDIDPRFSKWIAGCD